MAFRPQPKSEFGSLARYMNYLKQFPRVGQVRPGCFYVYVYDFDKENNPYSVYRYWDVLPLTFVYEIHAPKKKMFRGINFHHAPVRPRQIWLARVRNLIEEDLKKGKRLVRISSWYILFNLMKKLSKKSVRSYRMDRVSRLRKIPNNEIENVLRYYGKTYYGIDISRVEKDYLVFRWSK